MSNPQSTVPVLSSVPYLLETGIPGSATRGIATSQHTALASAIASLEPLQRTVLTLVYFDGQRQTQVADQLNRSTTAVAHAVSTGPQSVARHLDAEAASGGDPAFSIAPADAPRVRGPRDSPPEAIPEISRAM
jgi:DNA-directed RNA polymerase specialized sigma24 family protein